MASTFGLTAQDLTDFNADNALLHTDFSDATTKQNAALSATTTKKNTKRRVVGHSRALARRVKSHSTYEEAIGDNMGLEGPDDSTDLSQSSPGLRVQLTPDGVLVRFVKGTSDGVNLYSQRGAEAIATFLARDTNSPYLDSRDNPGNGPEDREYYAIFVKNDAEIGQRSATVKITAP